ncbi:MAG: aminotransferase class III-fold pyridoxal phosphate-dependent enzyme [Caulobacter sp.]
MPNAAFIAVPPPRVARGPAVSRGCRVIEADGESRIDFHMGGGSVLLGHAHPAVEAAVAEGVGGDRAAGALASLLPGRVKAVFCAEESQALPAAVEAARRITGRRRAAVWEPRSGELTLEPDVAALIVDPLGMSVADLRRARSLADREGCLLIFDEGTSSFRVHHRGAQGLSGVRPDLAVFGAALANGRPIGAVTGTKDRLSALDAEDLPAPRADSLAAAAATLDFLIEEPVSARLRVLGAEIQVEVEARVKAAGAGRLFTLAGDPTLPTPFFAAPALEGLWLREMADRGLIVLGPHALSAAHGDAEASALIEAYASLLPTVMARSLAEIMGRPRPLFDPLFSIAPEGRA